MAFPYSVQWMLVPTGDAEHVPSPTPHYPAQVMIVAPKRKFRHAVDRNRVRRLTRECYRLRKHALYAFLQERNLQLVFSMVYIHKEIMPYKQLEHKMDKLLATLEKEMEKIGEGDLRDEK